MPPILVNGTPNNDTINRTGDIGNYVIDGGAGNDTLYGGVFDDTLLGGTGNDSLYGNGGDDSIDAGAGNDKVYVSDIDGNDTLIGGAGNDFLELDRSTHDTQFNVTFDAGTPGLIQLADGTEFSGFEQVYFYAGNAD
ncbi:calcium-binding protein, partial [Shimia sp. CNT1-13L.2]|uniref:calcium-binding protein n=1 Tax=Shimia sp. CNT1-13L.2 TaxID=2959663 RepID=UPI002A09BDA5|nr:calcium-binding protein [Shimia sp. CNT1-13L.2]